jgi:hypothetical protein
MLVARCIRLQNGALSETRKVRAKAPGSWQLWRRGPADAALSLGAKLSVTMRRVALVALALASACAREPDTGLSTGPGATSVPLASTSTSTSSSTGESSSTSGAVGSSTGGAGSSSGAVPDMGLVPDLGPVQPLGCQGEDRLRVPDLAPRHDDDRADAAARPACPASSPRSRRPSPTSTCTSSSPTRTEPGPDGTARSPSCAAPSRTLATRTPRAIECGPDTWDLIKPCDETLGAGILFNVGLDATNHPCVLAEGRRYIALSLANPIPRRRSRASLRWGYGGGDPPIAAALVATVSPELNAEDGCNAGFLRSDALLVVTMITDVEDDQSPGKPATWYEAIVAAKGDPRSVVMLAVQPQALVGEKVPGCTYDGDGKLRLRELHQDVPLP